MISSNILFLYIFSGDGPYLVIDEQMSVRYNFTTEYKAGINAEA